MDLHAASLLDDTAMVVITGADLKNILYRAQCMAIGVVPKDEMILVWGSVLRGIVDRATPLSACFPHASLRQVALPSPDPERAPPG